MFCSAQGICVVHEEYGAWCHSARSIFAVSRRHPGALGERQMDRNWRPTRSQFITAGARGELTPNLQPLTPKTTIAFDRAGEERFIGVYHPFLGEDFGALKPAPRK